MKVGLDGRLLWRRHAVAEEDVTLARLLGRGASGALHVEAESLHLLSHLIATLLSLIERLAVASTHFHDNLAHPG